MKKITKMKISIEVLKDKVEGNFQQAEQKEKEKTGEKLKKSGKWL